MVLPADSNYARELTTHSNALLRGGIVLLVDLAIAPTHPGHETAPGKNLPIHVGVLPGIETRNLADHLIKYQRKDHLIREDKKLGNDITKP